MVTLGACCFTLVGLELYTALLYGDVDVTRVDPMRLVEGIAGGIGFLGAGAIITRGASVEGLTTAGGLWLSGAIGLACGGGHYAIGAFATAFGLVTLNLLWKVETAIHRQRSGVHDEDEHGDRRDKGAAGEAGDATHRAERSGRAR
jgi:putative Mg2+ transporter-C (MgtC) family protein